MVLFSYCECSFKKIDLTEVRAVLWTELENKKPEKREASRLALFSLSDEGQPEPLKYGSYLQYNDKTCMARIAFSYFILFSSY